MHQKSQHIGAMDLRSYYDVSIGAGGTPAYVALLDSSLQNRLWPSGNVGLGVAAMIALDPGFFLVPPKGMHQR